jgi:hypothetical protein
MFSIEEAHTSCTLPSMHEIPRREESTRPRDRKGLCRLHFSRSITNVIDYARGTPNHVGPAQPSRIPAHQRYLLPSQSAQVPRGFRTHPPLELGSRARSQVQVPFVDALAFAGPRRVATSAHYPHRMTSRDNPRRQAALPSARPQTRRGACQAWQHAPEARERMRHHPSRPRVPMRGRAKVQGCGTSGYAVVWR